MRKKPHPAWKIHYRPLYGKYRCSSPEIISVRLYTEKFMHRISLRLEKRSQLNPLDCYTFGKLIHYTADAFTYVHNDTFAGGFSCHRAYEKNLQKCFLSYLSRNPKPEVCPSLSIMETIRQYHREYCSRPQSIWNDSTFALQASCCVAALLYSPTKT